MDLPPIRPLAPADADAAVALWRATGLTRPWNDPAADYRGALACPTAAVLGARDGAALAGTVMVGWEGHRHWFYYLAVAAPMRRRGLGRALVAAGEGWLAARGAPKVHALVRDGNDMATDFWAALGYARQPTAVWGRRLEGQAP